MTMTDRINRANARSRRIPAVLLRLLLAWLMSGILLALLVPVIHGWGVSLPPWIVWGVIVAAFALAVGPDLLVRLTTRR